MSVEPDIHEEEADNLREFADPNCSRCSGSGSIHTDDGGALPRASLCPCVLVGRKRAAAQTRALSLFGEGNIGMTIGSYDTGAITENETALECAKNYVLNWETFRDQGAGFALHGPPGCGKTHLATGTLIALIKKWDVKPFYLSVPELLRLARKRFDDPTTADVLDRAMNADVYLLDDIGAEYHRQGSEGMTWVDEQLFIILNHRLNHNLPTLFTTNLTMRELAARLDDRVARRLMTATLALLPVKPVPGKDKADSKLRDLFMGAAAEPAGPPVVTSSPDGENPTGRDGGEFDVSSYGL